MKIYSRRTFHFDASKWRVRHIVTDKILGPPGSLSLWLVLSPPSASASNMQVLHLVVWCSLRALMTLKSPKKWKFIPVKVVGWQIMRKLMHISRIWKNGKPVSRGRKNIDSRITEQINPHSRFTQSKNPRSTKKLSSRRQVYWCFCG